LAVQRIRAGAEGAVAGTAALARTRDLEARTALVEGKQALQEVSNQIADLQEQLAILLDVPTCTRQAGHLASWGSRCLANRCRPGSKPCRGIAIGLAASDFYDGIGCTERGQTKDS